ncbi:rhotekin isoform X2 [Electrophorus electricus]|uniref:rhotekin isoform X2 n=1 Tax=Electrophorus electricus TaxID=8005 RepID=UPI0015D0BCA6|nr:rhotekin isoform X2 [Electrophorus electricus]
MLLFEPVSFEKHHPRAWAAEESAKLPGAAGPELPNPGQDGDLQKKIDREIRVREGACKLLAACTQRDQALEASKSLQTCSARVLAYMSELQRMKEAQVLQRVERRSSDTGPSDERSPCKGKVAISDLRIPLMWKDTEYFKNKGELHRCAVFCLLQLGGEIFDTDMVMVDRTLTDICFDNTIVFSEAIPGFELRVQLYSCCSEEDAMGGSTPRRLASKLSSSLGRTSGRRTRAALEPGSPSGDSAGAAPLLLPAPPVPGPKYHLLAHTTLTLAHVQDSFRTHDLNITGNEECSYWLPLYGSVCCRVAAQPYCMTQQMMSGCLRVKLGGDPQGWTDVYGVLKGTKLFCYRQQEDMEANVEPLLTIAINKETRIRAAEREPPSKAQSICISNRYGGEEVTHTLAADRREDTQRWMEAFWQHFFDMSQWKQCCDDLMKIELPSPRKPALVPAKQGSLYHEMVIDTSDDISTVTDILTRRLEEFDLRARIEAPPHWMSLFEKQPPSSPSLSPRCPPRTSAHSPSPHLHGRQARSPCRAPGLLSSDASLTSDGDSPRSASPHSGHAWPCDLSPASPGRLRPRTLSLDAKLSTLRTRAYASSACSCQGPVAEGASARPSQVPLSCSTSTSTSSNSSSEGSNSPESDLAFSRQSGARRSLRSLRAKLDPRNWLQSQV